MAAGTTIKLKRKAGAFTGGELAAGELGVDVSNEKVYGSSDGTTVFEVTSTGGSTAGLFDYKGGYNAATNSPDLDVSPSGILQADAYTVTTGGNFFSEVVEAGDLLIANQDDPTLASHWTILQTNIDGAALTANGLDQFAATTSAELAGVISDEEGTGALVFANSPELTTPTIASIVNTGTLTLPTSTDTLVGRDTTDTLTNKTISASTNTIDGGTI